MKHLFLFDIDGVLVEARGYLEALQETVNHFSRQMSLKEFAPTEKEVRIFEVNGFTSEWASGAVCVAALLLEWLHCETNIPLPARWPDALAILAAYPRPFIRPDYVTLFQDTGERLKNGGIPAQAARAIFREKVPGLKLKYPSAASALLDTLLGHTHDFYRAPVTRYFQHLVIGSRAVAQTYGVDPDFESPAYLERFDRPLLSPEVRRKLEGATANGQARVALYTARPSLPPIEADSLATGYSPEAEMARNLVGLVKWPIIGAGKMRWLAGQSGERLETLVKPSPVQALAAIGAARSGQEETALRAALALHGEGKLLPPLADLHEITIHVFEDSVGGLVAVKGGIEALQRAGAKLAWQPYGIASGGSKAAALAAQGVPVYPSVNKAALAALVG